MQDVISLFRYFKQYNHLSEDDLKNNLIPCHKLNQSKKHYNNKKLIGYTNWAFLSDKDSKHFVNTGDLTNWNSGDNLWHIDTVCIEDLKRVMSWTKSYFTKKFGVGKTINWIRTDQKKITKYLKVKTKRSWLWEE
tara:strand:- start:1123 stop:1527 length:405 start_codon:yes stop_codon:yes gene_type:complete